MDKYGIFWWSSGRRTVCIHDFTMKFLRLPLGLWWEQYWKYWAELIWNIAG